MKSTSWPLAVQHHLNDHCGDILAIETLSDKSGAQVTRLQFAGQSLILKQSRTSAEADFYEHIAPILRTYGIALPAVEAIIHDSSGHWLVIEDIPTPLPRDRWFGDPEILSLLAQLHSLEPTAIPPLANGYVPQWSNDLTEKALACFDNAAAPTLYDVQSRCQHLFDSDCWISADPNPGNWGLRADGTSVLFDWERFTQAAPAVDLAIVSPVYGTVDQYRSTAATYIEQRQVMNRPYPVVLEPLTRDIIFAKLWTLVEFLSLYTDGKLEPDTTLTYLTEGLPVWLSALEIVSILK